VNPGRVEGVELMYVSKRAFANPLGGKCPEEPGFGEQGRKSGSKEEVERVFGGCLRTPRSPDRKRRTRDPERVGAAPRKTSEKKGERRGGKREK